MIKFDLQSKPNPLKKKRRKEIKDFTTYLPYQEEVEELVQERINRKPIKKHEQSFCTVYQQWLMARGAKHNVQSAPWEAKHSRGKDSIPFADVPQHQRDALFACTTDRGFCYKISDQSAGTKPYDGIFYRNAPAYLVFAYVNKFYIISIHNFLHEEKTSKRKSLTEDRAKEISILSDSYKLK